MNTQHIRAVNRTHTHAMPFTCICIHIQLIYISTLSFSTEAKRRKIKINLRENKRELKCKMNAENYAWLHTLMATHANTHTHNTRVPHVNDPQSAENR